MDYKFFKKVNKIAKEKGATPVEVKDYDLVDGSLIATIDRKRDTNFLGREFMDMLMVQNMYYVTNPKLIKTSELIAEYEIKRRLQLHCSLEHDYYYHEFYERENYECNQTESNTTLIIDYLCPNTAARRYELPLGNLVDYFYESMDEEKTVKYFVKKAEYLLYQYKDICCFTKNEKKWLNYALCKELVRIRKRIELEYKTDDIFSRIKCEVDGEYSDDI